MTTKEKLRTILMEQKRKNKFFAHVLNSKKKKTW